MRSSLVARRLISLAPDRDGAGGGAGGAGGDPAAAGAAVEERDDAGGDGGGGGDPEDPPKSPWEKKLEELRGMGASDDDDEDDRPDDELTDDELAERNRKKKETADAARAGKDGGKPKDGKPGKKDETADDADETKPLLFAVPGRKVGDPDVELPLDRAALKKMGLTVKEARDRIGQLRNGYGRKVELERERAQIESARADLGSIRTDLREKPVEFMLDHVTPKHYATVVDELVARLSDEDFGKLVQRIARYDADPSRRRLEAADAKERTLNRRETAKATEETNRERSTYMTKVQDQIVSLVPEDMSEETANEFYELCAFKLTQWAKRQPEGTRLDPEKVPALLSELGALTPFGLTLDDDGNIDDEPESANARTRTTSQRPPARKPAASARDTGKNLRDRHDRRANAVTAPSGAGAAAANEAPPKGQTAKQRFEWLRKKFPKK